MTQLLTRVASNDSAPFDVAPESISVSGRLVHCLHIRSQFCHSPFYSASIFGITLIVAELDYATVYCYCHVWQWRLGQLLKNLLVYHCMSHQLEYTNRITYLNMLLSRDYLIYENTTDDIVINNDCVVLGILL